MQVADILSRVNQITGREVETIDTALYSVLTDISRRTLALKTEATGVTSTDNAYIDRPEDMAENVIDRLLIGDEEVFPHVPGRSGGYTLYGNRIYLAPPPRGVMDYILYYARLHPTDLSDILFPEVFFDAIVHGVAAKVYQDFEIQDKLADQATLYENQMRQLIHYAASPPVALPHRGI